MNDQNRLREQMRGIAEEARPVDLMDRALGTARRMRRRRTALTGLGSALVALTVVAGVAGLIPGAGDDTVAPGEERTERPAGSLPRVHDAGGGRESMDLTLPDGTRARLTYPKDDSFAGLQLGGEASYTTGDEVIHDPPHNEGCCLLRYAGRVRGERVGSVSGPYGERIEVWQGTAVTEEALPRPAVDAAFLDYGDWLVELPKRESVTLGQAKRIARKLSVRFPGGYPVFPANRGMSTPGVGFSLRDPDDVWLDGPGLRFVKGGKTWRDNTSIRVGVQPENRRDQEYYYDGIYNWTVVRDGLWIDVRTRAGTDDEKWARRLARELKVERLR